MKVNMLEQNLNVLTPAEFVFLENRKRDGVYNHETREKLYSIIEKLQRGKRNNSREEKKLYKIFRDANFGILLDKNSRTREKIIHSGKVQVLAKFEGEIIAQAVLIEKTASIAAEVVMCKGKVFDGRCSMPSGKKPGPPHLLREALRKTGLLFSDSNLSC